jgi:hypothetical protein
MKREGIFGSVEIPDNPDQWSSSGPCPSCASKDARLAEYAAEIERLKKEKAEECEAILRLCADMKYIGGIVERGTGSPIPEDVTVAKGILEYVKGLESRLSISETRLTEVCREAGVQRTRAEEAERRVCRVREALAEFEGMYVYDYIRGKLDAALSATGPCVHEAELEALEWSLDDCLAHYPADIFPEPTEEDFAHVHARKGCSEVLHGSWARHLVKVIRDNAARKLAEGGGK